MKENGLYKTIRISNITENVKGFKTFTFETINSFTYKAGQYLTLVSHVYNAEIRRSYSITSSPALSEPLSIGVKRIENGFFSRLLIDDAVTGDELVTIGAGGLFVLPADLKNYQQVFFFAAGSGITPVFSSIKTLLYAHECMYVVLIYSNTTPETSIFLDELNLLQQSFSKRFFIKFLFSNTLELSKARLHRSMIEAILSEHTITAFNHTLFYICGPQSYMRLCTYTLQENDVPKNNIKREDFVINAAPKRDALPPDKVKRIAFIKLNGKEYRFPVRYPDSILQAAKKENIALPYSCEAGRCGSCVAKCISGKIWHSYNEVLTEKELKQGFVLTCVGHPVGGDITLEINI